MQSDSSSQSQSESQSQSQTGQPQQSGQKKQATPEGPREGEKPGQENPKQQQDGQNPQNNQHSEETGPKAAANQNPEHATEDPNAPGSDAEVWGNLPIHLRYIFRAEGGQDMPAQYRDWIDNYYRRLNDRSGN